MPTDVYESVKGVIPEDIGVITYNGMGLRKKKECEYKDIGHEAQKWLMFSTLKKRINDSLFMQQSQND